MRVAIFVKISAFSLLFLASSLRVPAQVAAKLWAEADRIAMRAPASCNASMDSLAAYLKGTGRDEGTKARLVYTWIAHHVDYDVHSY